MPAVKSIDSPATSSGGTKNTACPRCHSSKPWGMASWCPECGYYPAIDGKRADAGSWADNMETIQPAVECGEEEESLLKAVDPWVWAMMAGIVGIVIMSFCVKTMYHDAGVRPGQWSWGQLLLGIGLILGGHAAAAVYAMKRDRRLNFSDVIIGWVAIWQPTISTLPNGHKRIWGVVWGATLAIASVSIIGDHNFSQLFADAEPVEKKEDKTGNAFGKIVGKAAAVAKKNGKKAASLEEALKNLADGSELQATIKELEELTGENEAFGEIFGYLPSADGLPSRVLLCSLTPSGVQYVGRVSAVDITPEALQLIAIKVAGEECEQPLCPCDEDAIWVNPLARCRIRYTSVAGDGTYNELQLVSVVKKDIARPKTEANNNQKSKQQAKGGKKRPSTANRSNTNAKR